MNVSAVRSRLLLLFLLFPACLLFVLACGGSPADAYRVGEDAEKTTLRVAVVDSAARLVEALAAEAARARPEQEYAFLTAPYSAGPISATRDGESELGVITRPPGPEVKAGGMEYLHLGQDILVVATHRSIDISGVTAAQLRQIYAGEIGNWKQLGGPDAEIRVLDRPERSSAKLLLRQVLIGAESAIAPEALVLERSTMMNASLTSLEHSIGYTSLGDVIIGELDVNVLDLDGVAPSPENVSEGRYLFFRPFGLLIGPSPTKNTMKFVDFLASDDAAGVIESLGYSPVSLDLVIATIPEVNVISQEARYRPLVDYLSSRLGPRMRISLRHLASYDDLIEEFVAGNVNAAFFGSFTYAATRARVEVDPVARPELNGESWYRGLILVREDSGIGGWQDLKGKRFSMVSSTTAADIFPRLHLKRHGVKDPQGYLGEIAMAPNHEASVSKVLSGEVEAGAVKDLIFERMAAEDPRVRQQLMVLASSLPVPENALVVRRDLEVACFGRHQRFGVAPASTGGSSPLDFRSRLRTGLFGLADDPEGREVLKKSGADRFVPTSDADYENLYGMLQELGMSKVDR